MGEVVPDRAGGIQRVVMGADSKGYIDSNGGFAPSPAARRPRVDHAHSPTRLLVPMLLLVGLSGLSACSHESATDDLNQTIPAHRFGVIALTLSETPAADRRVDAAGVFARHAILTRDEVLDVLNLPEVPDDAALVQPRGDCVVVVRSLGRGPAATSDRAFADLLDAGEVRLRTRLGSAALRRHTFPALYDNVDGVTYQGIVAGANLDRDGLVLEGRGSYEVGDFLVEARFPEIPRLRSVGGMPAGSDLGAVPIDEDLELRWSPGPADGRVYLELEAPRYDRLATLRCVARDRGRAALPQQGMAELIELAGDGPLRLTLRRIDRVAFAAPGLHTAEAFVVSRDSVPLR